MSPASSGYCLGSSNWIISSDFERVAYVSGSSTLTTHPRPIDQAPLRNVDGLILSSLIQTPLHNPDPMIGEFCKAVVETTKLGGNVLVPCYSSGHLMLNTFVKDYYVVACQLVFLLTFLSSNTDFRAFFSFHLKPDW